MKILVLNCGSSSLKFQLIETDADRMADNRDELLAKGLIERIGSAKSVVNCGTPSGGSSRAEKPIPDHRAGIQAAFSFLFDSGVLRDFSEIEGVGHRMVHGGEDFRESVIIDAAVVQAIQRCAELAPLHNPPNLRGYEASRELLPEVPHVAVFDTAFHSTIPKKAYLYALPYDLYEKHRVRRYGFHGTSHRFVAGRFAQLEHTAPANLNLITVHLGNGCSVTAVQGGHSIDTSLGLTPLEGLIMGTRPGDVDPGVLLFLERQLGMDAASLDEVLNRKSGLLGVSGVSNDMRDLLRHGEDGNSRARLAVEMFCYRVRKYIGAYFAALGRVDAVLFTGGIGENAAPVRAQSCVGLESLGIALDLEANAKAIGREARISSGESRTAVWVVPTNEELLIARDTVRCILGMQLE
jgi:acetate kinase